MMNSRQVKSADSRFHGFDANYINFTFELHTCHKMLTIAKTSNISLLQTVISVKTGSFLVPKNGPNLEVEPWSESNL